MGQNDVVQELKKEDWLSPQQISDRLNIGKSSVLVSLKKLLEYDEVLKKEVKVGEKNWIGFVYCLSPKMR